jgi:DNA replication protein DnaC
VRRTGRYGGSRRLDFDFSCVPGLNKQRVLELARGEYLSKAESIILVGSPGLGKTHIATSLALAACRQGHRVRFYNAAGLVNELIQAQDEHELPKFLATALRHRLIVMDELGFIPFSSIGAQLIFQFCSTLYERVSMLVTTNLRFADWTQVFGDERLTAALLDRLTHRAHILEFTGESFRFRQRMQREAEGGDVDECVDNSQKDAS